MTLKISPSFITIQDIPKEIFPVIFQSLNLAGCATARRVCCFWAELLAQPTTLFGQWLQSALSVVKLSTLIPRCSAWEQTPTHWIFNEKMLKLSSVCQEIIAFFPSHDIQSSKFFSFKEPLPFSDRDIFLAHKGDTYFLTPQSQTDLQLELQIDLRRLVSHTLIVKNIKDPGRDRMFSMLEDLPETEENLTSYQIERCFPASEDKVAIVTRNGTLLLWDLEPKKPVCCKRLKIADLKQYNQDSFSIGMDLHHVGDHLLFGYQVISLKDLSLIKQSNNLVKHLSIQICGSFIFTILDDNVIRLFSLNEAGLLIEKWTYNLNQYLPKEFAEALFRFEIETMSEQYIVLTFRPPFDLFHTQQSILILDINGQRIDIIRQDIADKINDLSMLDKDPFFARITGPVLMFKFPRQHTIFFYLIPKKKTLLKFTWAKKIYDFPLHLYGNANVQDAHFADGRLTILIKTGRVEKYNLPHQFRVIQFDPLHTVPSGIVNRLIANLKGLYYAIPVKHPT